MQCPYCRSKKMKGSGMRLTRMGPVQKLTCMSCKKSFSNDPSPGTHYPLKLIQQVFPFRYHTLKVNISAKLHPGLKRYIGWVISSLPDGMFMEGPRASTFKIDNDLRAE